MREIINIFINQKCFNMKRGKLTLVAVVLSGSLLFSSCVGSFGLFNRLSSWNQGVGNKFVNELVFLAFNIVPVYGVAYLADALVINLSNSGVVPTRWLMWAT